MTYNDASASVLFDAVHRSCVNKTVNLFYAADDASSIIEYDKRRVLMVANRSDKRRTGSGLRH